MCFSYSVNFNKDAIKSQFSLDELPEFNGSFFVSAFSYPVLPVIVKEDSYAMKLMHWGLIPHWCKDEENAAELRQLGLNARGETMDSKPLFRHAFKHRCLVPAAGFYEWRTFNNKKYPYYIYPKHDPYFLIAGIHSSWLNPDTAEEILSFSIVTCAANPMMEIIHNSKKRMPLILEQHEKDSWLDYGNDESLELVKPYDEKKMQAHTIGALVNSRNEDRNSPDVQKEYRYPELEQQLLL